MDINRTVYQCRDYRWLAINVRVGLAYVSYVSLQQGTDPGIVKGGGS